MNGEPKVFMGLTQSQIDAIQPGPCVVCGLRNYRLSMGGPGICPACDCGNFGPNLVGAQKRRIEELEAMLAERSPAALHEKDTK